MIRDISDTARWAAVFRARETDRPDAVFRDPFARRLAGARGEEIANNLSAGNRQTWAWITRTYLFDQFIGQQVAQGVDMIVNLAAGLDARPYRMNLPASLNWVEVDLPDLLSYKEEILRDEKPVARSSVLVSTWPTSRLVASCSISSAHTHAGYSSSARGSWSISIANM